MNQELQQFVQEFQTLSNEPSIDIKISPLAAYCLIVQIQLALRYPENDGDGAAQVKMIAKALESRLELSPLMQHILERGWNEEYDTDPSESLEEYLARIEKIPPPDELD